ncbi:MAG: hypothetical protein ACE14V_11135, partial [bacterium]
KSFIFKIAILSILGCLIVGIAGAVSELTVSGMVKDGISNQLIPDAKVYFSIQSYSTKDKQQVEYSGRTTADPEGKYQFAVSIDTTKFKRNRYLRILVTAKGYISAIYNGPAMPKIGTREIKYNFGLLPEGKEATVKGSVYDAATLKPLPNIKVDLSLLDSDFQAETYIKKDNEIRQLVTNTKGIYETQIPSKYVDQINFTSRWWIYIQNSNYDIVAVDHSATGKFLSRDTTQPEPNPEMNIAMNITDYYLVNKTAAGKLAGTLLDPNNIPSMKTNVRIEILPAGALMNRTGRLTQTDQGYMNTRIANFEKELSTDNTGKFSCAIPLRYIYNPNYTFLITATIAGTPGQQSFTKLCIPGESKRELEQKLDNGYILKLAIETFSRKER